MDVFPAAFPLHGLKVVVVGAGEAADAKARLFDGSPAQLMRIPPDRSQEVESYAGARLAFIALPGDAATGAAAAARAAGALVNVVDRPELCDFNTPAIIDRGAVVGAVATGGAAPLLAAELRRGIEARWPAGLGGAAQLMQRLQAELRAALPAVADRRAWLRGLLEGAAPGRAIDGDMAGALALARAQMSAVERIGQFSILVPPTSVDLLSLRALRALGRADRLVVALDTDPALVALARRDAPVSRLGAIDVAAIAAEVGDGAFIIGIGELEAFKAFGAVNILAVASEQA